MAWRQHKKERSEHLACALQKREAKACLEAAGKMLKVHAAGRIPLNRKEDEIYKVRLSPLRPALS